MKTKTVKINVCSHYGNLRDVIMLGRFEPGVGADRKGEWVVSEMALRRANRNGAGDFYDRTDDGLPVVGGNFRN